MPMLRPWSLLRPLSSVGAYLCIFATGCPSQIEPGRKPPPAAPQPDLDASDTRVVEKNDVLYPADTLKRAEPPKTVTARGSGKPDESNGVCRLYAPKHDAPICCPAELGFDAAMVAKTCGFSVYLGESMDRSCGYHFHNDTSAKPVWLRASFVQDATAKEAAETMAALQRRRRHDDKYKAEAIKGVKAGYWFRDDGLVWAFIDGWEHTRRLTWRQSFCTDEAMASVLEAMRVAVEPRHEAPRTSLVPVARTKK